MGSATGGSRWTRPVCGRDHAGTVAGGVIESGGAGVGDSGGVDSEPHPAGAARCSGTQPTLPRIGVLLPAPSYMRHQQPPNPGGHPHAYRHFNNPPGSTGPPPLPSLQHHLAIIHHPVRGYSTAPGAPGPSPRTPHPPSSSKRFLLFPIGFHTSSPLGRRASRPPQHDSTRPRPPDPGFAVRGNTFAIGRRRAARSTRAAARAASWRSWRRPFPRCSSMASTMCPLPRGAPPAAPSTSRTYTI